MTEFEIFERCTGGKRANTDRSMLDSYRERWCMIPQLLDHGWIKPYPTIVSDFLHHEEFNALADKYSNSYVIAINEAVIIILRDLFNRMLCCPNVLPQIGDISNEVFPDEYKIPDYYQNTRDLVEFSPQPYIIPYPTNPTRNAYANLLFDIALDYIYCHEFSHIVYGHVDFVIEKYGLNGIRELVKFNDVSYSREYNLVRQTLEMDADCTSAARCLYLHYLKFQHQKNIDDKFKKFYGNEYYIVFHLMFAIATVMIITGEGEYRDLRVGMNCYPAPSHRVYMMMSTIKEAVRLYYRNIDVEKASEYFVSAVYQAYNAFSSLTSIPINKDIFESEFFGKHPIMEAVIEKWKDIRPLLYPYAYRAPAP